MTILFRFLLMVSAFAIFSSTACRTKEEVPKEGTVFYFYPEQNIYFDEDNNQYFMQDKEAGWQVVTVLPEGEKEKLGTKIRVQQPDKPVWKNNAQDRLLYSVQEYASASNYAQKFTEDSLNSLPKKSKKIEEATPEEKLKSGFGKFLDKVFSKKEKKKEKK